MYFSSASRTVHGVITCGSGFVVIAHVTPGGAMPSIHSRSNVFVSSTSPNRLINSDTNAVVFGNTAANLPFIIFNRIIFILAIKFEMHDSSVRQSVCENLLRRNFGKNGFLVASMPFLIYWGWWISCGLLFENDIFTRWLQRWNTFIRR